jgi:hypothetical protein
MDSGPVPAGFVWVVRSVSVLNFNSPFSHEQGWQLSASSIGNLCGVGAGFGAGSVNYNFDLHQVITAGATLHFGASVTGYSFSVSGYRLSLP